MTKPPEFGLSVTVLPVYCVGNCVASSVDLRPVAARLVAAAANLAACFACLVLKVLMPFCAICIFSLELFKYSAISR